jgi:DNA polymerase I-like protein with 3'-5' exonuclease and polymerase domains
MKLKELPVGRDGRNRRILSAFGAMTSRNTPSSSQFIFGQAAFQRHLIKPPEGCGVAYIDWEQQEFGIAAALSGDGNMLEAYQSGDPYLAFAKQAGAVPTDATKQSHPQERDQFKTCTLAVQYGMGTKSLALRLGRSPAVANDLMQAHKRTYRKFWQWIEQFVGTAVALRRCHTVLGWGLQIAPGYNARTLYNFPMQGNGAEMLRQGCCLGTERGIEVAAPVHDAVMICAPLNHLEHDIAPMQAAMAQASRIILDGFELRTEAKPVRYPDRFVDPRGKHMWETVQQLMGDLKCKKAMA